MFSYFTGLQILLGFGVDWLDDLNVPKCLLIFSFRFYVCVKWLNAVKN